MYIFLQLMALPVLRSRSFFDGAQAGLWLYREVEKKTKVVLPVQVQLVNFFLQISRHSFVFENFTRTTGAGLEPLQTNLKPGAAPKIGRLCITGLYTNFNCCTLLLIPCDSSSCKTRLPDPATRPSCKTQLPDSAARPGSRPSYQTRLPDPATIPGYHTRLPDPAPDSRPSYQTPLPDPAASPGCQTQLPDPATRPSSSCQNRLSGPNAIPGYQTRLLTYYASLI